MLASKSFTDATPTIMENDDAAIDESGFNPIDTTFVSSFAIRFDEFFLDATDFKDRLADWSVDAHFGYRFEKSERIRVWLKCRAQNAVDAGHCPFHIRARFHSGSQMFVVGGTSYNACHTCPRDTSLFRSAISTQRWLAHHVHEVIQINSTTSPTTIHTAITNW